MSLERGHIGVFTRPEQTAPVITPPIPVACPICGRPTTEDDVRTVSIRPAKERVCFFFRLHRTCGNDASPKLLEALDVRCVTLGRELVAELRAKS